LRQVSLLGPKDDSAMINGPGKQPINKLGSEVTIYALLRRYWGDSTGLMMRIGPSGGQIAA
jgi:hypothetical protein